jgi:hypothetical protein
LPALLSLMPWPLFLRPSSTLTSSASTRASLCASLLIRLGRFSAFLS